MKIDAAIAGDAIDSVLAMASRLERPQGFLQSVANILREDVARQFQAGGIPAWAPLSPNTIAAKRRAAQPRVTRKGPPPSSIIQQGNFGPESILVRSAALYSSWTDKDDSHHIEEISADAVTIGSSLPYAAVHQDGASFITRPFGRGKGVLVTIPARPVTITPEALKRIELLAAQLQENA